MRHKGTNHRLMVQQLPKQKHTIENISHDPLYIYCKKSLTGFAVNFCLLQEMLIMFLD